MRIEKAEHYRNVAKGFLLPILEREKYIAQIRRDIGEARQSAYHITSGWSDGSKVQRSHSRGSRQDAAIAKLAALDSQLESAQREQREHRSKLWRYAMKMENRNHTEVLLYRYFLCLRWEGVSHALELSDKQVYRNHNAALTALGMALSGHTDEKNGVIP